MILQDVYPFDKFYAGWFGGCKTSDIYRDNVRELLAWALHAKKMDDITRQVQAHNMNYIDADGDHQGYAFMHKMLVVRRAAAFSSGATSILLRESTFDRLSSFSSDFFSISSPRAWQEMAGINNVLYWLKARFQIDTPEGYNPNAKAMRLTIEEVSYVHRPLVYYAFLTTLQVHAVQSHASKGSGYTHLCEESLDL